MRTLTVIFKDYSKKKVYIPNNFTFTNIAEYLNDLFLDNWADYE